MLSFVFNHPSDVQKALRTAPRKRSEAEQASVLQLLRGFNIFRALDERLRALVGKVLHYSAVPEHFTVCKQGDPSDRLYIVLSGLLAVKVFMPSVNQNITINTMDPGTSFGQLGLIRQQPVSAHPHPACVPCGP